MITTWFPRNTNAEKLERAACLHAIQLDGERDRLGASGDTPADRLVVNYLRHECTDYDEDQTQERHREVCEAIAARFPWLAEECARQIKRRADSEREHEGAYQQWLYEQEQEKAERRALVEESKKTIASLSVGQKVMYQDRRNTYEATVSKIGRSKVTIEYEVKTGKDRARTKAVHAALLTSIEATA